MSAVKKNDAFVDGNGQRFDKPGRKIVRAVFVDATSAADNAETLGMILPQWAQTLGDFAREWGGVKGGSQEICRQIRGLVGAGTKKRISMNEFLLPPLNVQQMLALHGFHLRFDNPKEGKKLTDKNPWLKTEAAMLALDIAREWFLTDNTCAMWVQGRKRKSKAPAVTVINTERITNYENGVHGEKLEIESVEGGGALIGNRDDLIKAYGKRWGASMADGKPLVLDEEAGEFYRIRCRAKRGAGLARPTLEGVLPLIGQLEMLALADRGAAWEHRNVIRQWLIGHDIRYGNRAGMTDHFIKKEDVQALRKKLAGLTGPFDIYTNFDYAVKYNFLPTEFFKKEKYEGALMRLAQWFGPVGRMLREEIRDNDFPVVRAWIDSERETIGGMVEDILNAPEYWDGVKPKVRIGVGFSPSTAMTPKMIMEMARFASAQGAIGQQTTREMLGFDHERERRRIEEEAENPDGNVPYFEQKQGIVSGSGDEGGRPPEKI